MEKTMSSSDVKPWEDPKDERNGPSFHSGKKCIEHGCNNPAGTAWSPFWCFEHNKERINKINAAFESLFPGLTLMSSSDIYANEAKLADWVETLMRWMSHKTLPENDQPSISVLVSTAWLQFARENPAVALKMEAWLEARHYETN